jgi:hypothetical protein
MKKKALYVPIVFGVFFLALGCAGMSLLVGTAYGQKAAKKAEVVLTNDQVIDMVKAGVSESLIISQIRNSKTDFDLSTPELIRLSKAGVSEKVIAAMRNPQGSVEEASEEASPAPSSKSAGIPSEVGVYVKKGGRLVEVEPEVVNMRTGGYFKAVATAGIKGPQVKGFVNGPSSSLQVSSSIEFIIRCSEGTSAAEYQLVRMDEKKDRREFQVAKVTTIRTTTGVGKNGVSFTPNKIGRGTYSIKLTGLSIGQYGFLQPGLSVSNGSTGKVYTFTVH